MDRLIDEIVPSCAATLIRTPTINRSLMPCRGLIAISKISPLPSQRILNLSRLIQDGTARKSQVTFKTNKVGRQSPTSI
jgi:hypothetical protein